MNVRRRVKTCRLYTYRGMVTVDSCHETVQLSVIRKASTQESIHKLTLLLKDPSELKFLFINGTHSELG